ncbi:MAG: glycosyltransferase [Deltaproteobacteria bacterium]|nr:glycosyltransferase [Deltaproteobacteria bacterium]
MRIVVEARNIRPGKVRGVEHFCYLVVRGLSGRGDSVELQVPHADRGWYREYFRKYPDIEIAADPIGRLLDEGYRLGMPWNLPFRLSNLARRVLFHEDPVRRRHWERRRGGDVAWYPLHRDAPQHAELPLVTTIHALLPEYTQQDIAIVRRHAERAQAVVTSWPNPFQELPEQFPCLKDKLFMIPFTPVQNVEHPDEDAFRSLELNEPYFLYPGGYQWRKNHDVLVSAYGQARREGVDLPTLVCCGGGNQGVRARLERLAGDLGVRRQFRFLDYVPERLLAALYRHAFGTVSSTLWEAGMATLQEGCYWGIPAACSDIAPARAHAELLDLDVCFFDPKDPLALAERLVHFVEHIDRYRVSAQGAASRVRAMGPDFVGKAYRDVFAYAAGLADRPAWGHVCNPQGSA